MSSIHIGPSSFSESNSLFSRQLLGAPESINALEIDLALNGLSEYS